MEEGTLVSWLVSDGDNVTVDTPIYVLETDKVENEISAGATGKIRLLASEGETHPVGTVIAEVHED